MNIHTGQTALHTLSLKASVSDQHTCWDGRTLSVCQAWLALADLLLTLGANPSLPDHSNKYASHLAQDLDNHQLTELLVKVCYPLDIRFAKHLQYCI